MTTRTLRTLAAVGVLGLTVSLASCGEDEPSTPAESLAPSTVPASTSSPSASSASKPKPSKNSQAPSGPSLDVTVTGDKIDPVNKSFSMTSGQTLTLDITSDRAGELHVHSRPEQELEFGKGRTKLEITLNEAGTVDIEEHESHSLLARVLVK